LMDEGVNIFGTNIYSGNSALSYSAEWGRCSTVSLLLESGWDADSHRSHRSAAFRAAVLGKHTDVARLILDCGIDIDEPSPESGLTPLEMAILGRDEKTVALLLDSGADINRVTTSRVGGSLCSKYSRSSYSNFLQREKNQHNNKQGNGYLNEWKEGRKVEIEN